MIEAIAYASGYAVLGVAIVVLALKLANVTPALVEAGKAQIQAMYNQQTAENERDQEKAAREEAETELAAALLKVAAAEKALAACGAKGADDAKAKIEADPNVHAAVADALGELSAGVSASGSAGAAASGSANREAGPVLGPAGPAKPTDGAGK